MSLLDKLTIATTCHDVANCRQKWLKNRILRSCMCLWG